jgi:hypothetical protein
VEGLYLLEPSTTSLESVGCVRSEFGASVPEYTRGWQGLVGAEGSASTLFPLELPGGSGAGSVGMNCIRE